MNILVDVIPPKARKYVYALVALASLLWGAFEASQGDWKIFAGTIIAALTAATAASNTPKRDPARDAYVAEHGAE